jgi:crotonobetainyl-CoA:carnitine CoA-transferase CaiB-like acyl-CoA transferase
VALLMGDVELDKNPLFLSAQERLLRWRDLDALLEPWLMSHDSDEIVELAQQLRMPFARVPTVAGLLESAHLKERGFFVEAEHPEAGRLTQTGAPFEMSETPFEAGCAPTLGEHNAEILTGDLGYETEELGILRDRGII